MARAHFNTCVFLACGLAILDAVAAPSPDAPDPDLLEYLAQHDEPGVPLPEPGEPDRSSSTEPVRPAPTAVNKQ